MKEKIKIEDSEEYNQLLSKYKEALSNKIPYSQNCLIQYHQDALLQMQYGPSCVVCSIETESSGLDKYLIYLNRNNEAEFIRLVTEVDTL